MIKQIILKLFNKYKGKMIGLFACVIVTSTISSFYPLLFSKLIDSFVVKTNINMFIMFTMMYGIVFSFEQLLHFQLNILWSYLCTRIIFDVRLKVFKQYFSLTSQQIKKTNIGDVVKIINEDSEEFSTFIHNNCFYLIANAVQLLVSIIIVFSFSPLFFYVLIVFVLLNIIVTNQLTKIVQKKQFLFREKNGNISSKTYEILEGFSELRVFGIFNSYNSRFNHLNTAAYEVECQIKMTELFIERVGSLLMMLMTLVMYYLIAGIRGSSTFTVGMLIAVIEYYRKTSFNLSRIISSNTNIKKNIVNMRKVVDFLAIKTGSKMNDIKCEGGDIKIENLDFYYEDKHVLKNVSTQINIGDKVAIVGSSGSGKSTLLSMIGRKNHYEHGLISINNIDVRSMNKSNYAKKVAYMDQETLVLDDTVIHNIVPWKSDRFNVKISDILTKSCLNQVVLGLENGVDTVLSADQTQLSGGELQRLGISRVFALKPEILLLDEPTASLDYNTEKVVLNSLFDTFEDQTIIIVSHKLTTILMCEWIIVMSDGQIVDSGKHNDLILNSKEYNRIFFNEIVKEA